MLEEELRSAAARGNFDQVKELLKQGAKFAPDSSGRTPLHLSSAAGQPEIVKALINPKNVNSIDAVGRTPLQIAASCGHVDVVNLLLKNGANVNSRDTLHGNTSIHEASWHGLSRTLSLLAKASCELDVPNSAGFAAIHLACQNGHNQSCRELLLAGANSDAQNNYGDTSLHTSARYGHAGVARILLSAGCKVSQQNKNGDTALHISAAMGRRKLTSIFLEAGCDKTVRNKQFETARDIAMRKGHLEILSILDSSKSSKSKKNKQKKSSETSDSDKRSKDHSKKSGNSGTEKGEVPGWSPYGCHYYPDLSLFPQPKLDSLPCEPLCKGEQYYLDLAGNICKGPVGVGLTCHCRNFVLDMESRLERHSAEVRARLRSARARLEHRVTKTEGMLNEYLAGGRSSGRNRATHRSNHRSQRSRSLDMLKSNENLDEIVTLGHIHIDVDGPNVVKNGIKSSDSEAKSSSKGANASDSESNDSQVATVSKTSVAESATNVIQTTELSSQNSDRIIDSNQNAIQTFSVQV